MPQDYFRQPGADVSTPALSASWEQFDNATVIHLTGDLDMATVGRAEQALEDAVQDTTSSLILDLSGITFFASTGLHLLVRLKAATCDQDQNLHVVAAHRRVLRPLQLTELDAAFEIHPTVEHALTAALRPPAP